MTEPKAPAAPEPAAPTTPGPAAPPAAAPAAPPAPAPAAPPPTPAPAKAPAPKQDVRDQSALIDSLTGAKDRFASKYEKEARVSEGLAADLAASRKEVAEQKARNALLAAGITDKEMIDAMLPGQMVREDPTVVPQSLVEKLVQQGVPTQRAPSNGSPASTKSAIDQMREPL